MSVQPSRIWKDITPHASSSLNQSKTTRTYITYGGPLAHTDPFPPPTGDPLPHGPTMQQLPSSEQIPPMSTSPITTVTAFLDTALQRSAAPHRYAFRGQEQAKWPLRSAATRRLLATHGEDLIANNPSTFRPLYLQYLNDTLISPAKRKGLVSTSTGNELEVLATLQHHGAATGLLDFTYNPLVALWFAAQGESHNGKVFVITLPPLHDNHTRQQNLNQQQLDKIFFPAAGDDIHIWDPAIVGEAAPRVLAQQSVFIVDRPLAMDSLPVEDIIVDSNAKGTLLSMLAALGISQEVLFADLPGFASTNGPLAQIDYPIEDSKKVGLSLMKSCEYEACLPHLSNHLNYQSGRADIPDVHALRGNAYAELRMAEEAIADYDRAIERYDELSLVSVHSLYFNRANMKASQGRHSEAVADYSTVLSVAHDHEAARFNRANSYFMLDQGDDAISDYKALPECQASCYNMGNALVGKGEFAKALGCYQQSAQMSGEHSARATINQREVEGLSAFGPDALEREKMERNTVAARYDLDDEDFIEFSFVVKGDRSPKGFAHARLLGNLGNRGTLSPPGFPTGKDFPDKNRIYVSVSPRLRSAPARRR